MADTPGTPARALHADPLACRGSTESPCGCDGLPHETLSPKPLLFRLPSASFPPVFAQSTRLADDSIGAATEPELALGSPLPTGVRDGGSWRHG